MSVEVTASTQTRSRKPRSSTLRDCVLAFGSGALLFASFPPRPLWFLAPFAVALLVLVLTRFGAGDRAGTAQDRPPLRLRGAFGYGFLAGLGFLLPLLPWVGEYVGPAPWLALAAAEAVFFGLFGVLAVILARLPLAPLWIACAWTLTEWLRSSVPFGASRGDGWRSDNPTGGCCRSPRSVAPRCSGSRSR
ncbi:apolipoN-acyltransferase domain protein [Rhodococcus sp. MTM3W5.2]|nr:apolipoN-acyltransferase domain protein [Rhodococcus sp. MTM3W5.2]